MSAHSNIISAGIAFLVLFLFMCGCVSSSVGDIIYTNGSLAATINNPGQPVDAFVQVTVYQVDGLSQQEYTVVMAGVKLASGENSVRIPVTLRPGTYKLNIYLIQEGERKTAVIRDIVV
ncbi:MAG: hypothetical protein M0Q91_09375 [Methanoregula sp.]|jgi:hypothetical protein|nr:hypothetical protein [Methanoregula sp.]